MVNFEIEVRIFHHECPLMEDKIFGHRVTQRKDMSFTEKIFRELKFGDKKISSRISTNKR